MNIRNVHGNSVTLAEYKRWKKNVCKEFTQENIIIERKVYIYIYI